MITKQSKQNLLSSIKDKDEKMKIASVIDKCNRSEAQDKIIATPFLDLNEKSVVTSMLNSQNAKYSVFFPNDFCEKSVIFFVPDFIDEICYADYISCIKIKAKDMSKLKHKDFMGSIYALGIKNEYIGDIFLNEEAAYVFVLKEVEKFMLENLFKVGNQEVECENIDIAKKEVKNLKIEYILKSYIVPSRRVDAILSEVYKLSRKEAKEKIVAGDLYINCRQCINPSVNICEGDIVSFRKCGKLKVGQELRVTKSGNINLNIYRYK